MLVSVLKSYEELARVLVTVLACPSRTDASETLGLQCTLKGSGDLWTTTGEHAMLSTQERVGNFRRLGYFVMNWMNFSS